MAEQEIKAQQGTPLLRSVEAPDADLTEQEQSRSSLAPGVFCVALVVSAVLCIGYTGPRTSTTPSDVIAQTKVEAVHDVVDLKSGDVDVTKYSKGSHQAPTPPHQAPTPPHQAPAPGSHCTTKWCEWAVGATPLPLNVWITFYLGIPIVSLILMWIWLRCIWPPAPKVEAPKKVGTAETDKLASNKQGDTRSAGQASISQKIPYLEPWPTCSALMEDPMGQIFDFYFLVGWLVLAGALVGLTWLVEPDLLTNSAYWTNMGVKFGVMVLSSVVGGGIARACISVDDRGYCKTDPKTGKTLSKVKGFKVNYTRKIQHFAAYAVPILVPSPVSDDAITLMWGDTMTLLGFLITIKPIRELGWFFMMQFNSYDRPEDRPYTLKWIILGDIAPGMAVLVLFWLFIEAGGWTCINGQSATALSYIFIMVTGLGDGFAEPVGVHWGRHKYQVYAICQEGKGRAYQRSFEGSCCVAFSVFVFVSMRWYLFPNATAFALTQIVMPPLMALAEAKSPHTMDTPFLFGVGGVWLWLMLFCPALSFIEP